MEVVLHRHRENRDGEALLQLLDPINGQIRVESVEPETASQYHPPECFHVNHEAKSSAVVISVCLSPMGTVLLFAVDRKYLIVMNIFEGVADHANAHVNQVRGGHLEDLLGELLTVLVDLL